MAANAQDLRRRAAETIAQAEAALDSAEGSDAPPTAEALAEHDRLMGEAEAFNTQANDLEARAARRAAAAAALNAAPPDQADTNARNTRNGRHRYSAQRALQAHLRGVRPDGLEGEVHADLVRDRSVKTRGFLVPMSAEISYRAFSASGATSTIVRGPIRDALMSRLVLALAGAQPIVSSGVFKLPTATSGATYWVSNASPTAANRSIGEVAFSAHTIAGKTKIDRQTLTTANVDTIDYIFNQLIKDIAVGYQRGAFHGAGSSGEPKGLFSYSSGDGVNVKVKGTDGGALALADLTAMTGAVESADAPDGQSWITSPALASKLESTVKAANTAVYLLDPGAGKINGRPYTTTSSVRSDISKGAGSALSAIAFGAWSEAIMAFFSAIDVFENPYTDDGGNTLSGFLDCDFALAHPAAFSICVDAATT